MKLGLNSLTCFIVTVYLLENLASKSLQAELTTLITNKSYQNFVTVNYNYEPPPKPVTRSPIQEALDKEDVIKAVPAIEATWEQQYENYFKRSFPDLSITAKDVADTLKKLGNQTGTKSALIYVVPTQSELELVIITPGNQPIHKRVKQTNSQQILEQVVELRNNLANSNFRNNKRYLPIAQRLYQWIIQPLEIELENHQINNLIFCMGSGLRTLPLAVLHDGKQFLIEKFSLTRIPAFKLTNTLYTDLRKVQVLAMGASEFKNQNPLPSVPVELSTITPNLWQGKSFLNQKFTISNLQSAHRQTGYKIIHLATHADFKSGTPQDSYVQFWDAKLTIDQISKLGLNNPPVELLVLSACKTAIGDEKAELGFAGLAVQSVVKSAIASLWYVSDEGTLALMTELYRHLQTAPIKAEALRQAQIAMLKGEMYLRDGQLHTPKGNIPLPPELAQISNDNFSHPYYWSAFTVVGSPW